MSRANALLNKLTIVWEPISTIVLIIVSILAFCTFFDDQRARREAFTIEIASQYTTEPLLSYRLRLIEAVGGAQKIDGSIRTSGRELSGYFVAGVPGSEEMQRIREALIALDLYFVSVASCVGAISSVQPSDEGRESVCDRALMFRLLNEEPTGFQCAYGELLDTMRRQYNLPNLGLGLENLSVAMSVSCE